MEAEPKPSSVARVLKEKKIETSLDGLDMASEQKFQEREQLQRKILDLKMDGMNNPEIAEHLQLSLGKVNTVSREMGHKVKRALNGGKPVALVSRSQAKQMLQEGVPAAIKKVRNLISSSKREDVQLAAAKDLLDRSGLKPVEQHLHMHLVEEMDSSGLAKEFRSVLNQIKSRHEESTQEETQRPITIEVQPEGEVDVNTPKPETETEEIREVEEVTEAETINAVEGEIEPQPTEEPKI